MSLPEAPPVPPPVDSAGRIVGAAESYNTPTANQGAFGGERIGLPQHASRRAGERRGPAQRALRDTIGFDELREQLGDGTLERLIAAKAADDGNARVNVDVRGDTPLYDDSEGAEFERSMFIDPRRRARGGARVGGPPSVRVSSAPPGSAAELPVAYEVAAVGARLANVARVGGQRVL
jgi:hypothetical protein